VAISPGAQAIIDRARSRSISRDNPLLETLPPWVLGFRDHQITAIQEVVDAFDRVPVVILDAPTGSGKTLIAESVRRLLRSRAVYICTTKGLQDQFVNDYPYAKVLKGRSNYPTELFPHRADDRFDPLTCAECTKKKGDPESCKWCSVVSRCPYEIAKHEALSADVAVLNTSYFLTECNGPGRFKDAEFVIADEADTLERELMGYVSVEISSRRAKRYGINPPTRITVKEAWAEWLDMAIPLLQKALREVDLSGSETRAIREAKYLAGTVEKLRAVQRGLDDGNWVYTGRDDDISFRPSRVDDIGQGYLWSHAPRWLLMSATVISAQELTDSLGYRGSYEVVTVPNTFPVEHRIVKFKPVADMARKHGEAAKAKVANATALIAARHPNDRMLVHTVSYDLASVVVDKLKPLPRSVLSYTSAQNRASALATFRRSPGAILVAPSMDRGIDLPDDACRIQVIAKVPFPFLGDRQVAARLHSPGGQGWYTVQTIRTIVQMCGRAVRSADDWAVTYILDSQFQHQVWSRGRGLFPTWFSEAIEWR
jgi:ATP-dependent DNA helicase DinG